MVLVPALICQAPTLLWQSVNDERVAHTITVGSQALLQAIEWHTLHHTVGPWRWCALLALCRNPTKEDQTTNGKTTTNALLPCMQGVRTRPQNEAFVKHCLVPRLTRSVADAAFCHYFTMAMHHMDVPNWPAGFFWDYVSALPLLFSQRY